jgi:multidrug efflux pump
MSVPALFIRRPIATVLLTLGLALAGLAAFFMLPVAPLPQVDIPVIQVSANLPGASPETMATSVATPLEKHLGVISDLDVLTSESSVGQTNVALQFGLSRDIDGAARDVQAAINAARIDLPTTLRANPIYRKINPADQPILILALTSDYRTPGQIFDVASTIVQQQLSQVKGVGQVLLGGASLPAVRVELNLLQLAHYGIGLEDVRAALASANANRPKGVVQDDHLRFQIYTNDTALDAKVFRPLVIAYRNGSAVRLSDVARVVDGVTDVRNMGLFNGRDAVIVRVLRTPGANIIATADRVKALLPGLQAVLPADIDVHLASDRTTTIRASVAEVERAVLVSTILVVVVVAFFLRNGRAVLIPSVAVVVSLLGAVAVMYLLKFSLNNLSLMALTVATGFVVDDAIVVLENVTRHVEAGMGRFEAALQGAREVAFTVFSISLSLVAVFIPILFMGGLVGRLFREFAVTLSAAVLVSLVISLTTTPMMCAYLIDPAKPKAEEGPIGRFAEKVFEAMRATYQRALDWALDSGPLMLVVFAVTIVLTMYLYVIVPKGLLPDQDTGLMAVGLQTDQSSSFAVTGQRLRRIVQIIRQDPAVATEVAFAGGFAGGGFMFVTLKPKGERSDKAAAVVKRLRPKLSRLPGVNVFLNPIQDVGPGGGRGGNASNQFTLQAEDLAQLRLWATRLAEQLKKTKVLVDISTDQDDHGVEAFVEVNRDRAAALHITNVALDNTLYDAFGQRQVSTIYKAANQYKVVMEADEPFTQDPTALNYLYVSTGTANAGRGSSGGTLATASTGAAAGANIPAAAGNAPGSANTAGQPGAVSATAGAALAVGATAVAGPSAPPGRAASQGVALSTTPEVIMPLSAFAHWADQSTPTEVNHQDGQPSATISYNLAPGRSASDAIKAVADAENEIRMPASVHGSFQGLAKFLKESLDNQPLLLVVALLSIYAVLGILYESYIHPLTVISTLPSAGIGALVALILLRMDFSIIALIAVFLLMGIVKKNAILMIDFAVVAERDRGLSAHDAIREAALTRFRPIMMTTFAAILGALPLAIGGGEGSELRQPLGVAIIGGLMVSQVITLLTTPVVYIYLDRLNRRGPRPAARAGNEPLGALS